MHLPSLSELHANLHVVTLDLVQEFRGVTSRELVVFEGPSGWGEFAPFLNHSDQHSARWLQAAVESAFGKWPAQLRTSFEVNAIIPMLPAAEIEKFDGHKTIDIAIVEKRVNIEVDGIHHNANPQQAFADLQRTYFSFLKGYLTLRIPNSLVRNNLEETADMITEILNNKN